jgi:hypothetical protein
MYEKSIGSIHRIYAVTVTTTKTLAIDLLSPADKADYDRIVNVGEPTQPYVQSTLNMMMSQRHPVDGYIYSDDGNILVSTSATGANETIPQFTQYPIPVYFWLNKTWFSTESTNVNALIRVFFG